MTAEPGADLEIVGEGDDGNLGLEPQWGSRAETFW